MWEGDYKMNKLTLCASVIALFAISIDCRAQQRKSSENTFRVVAGSEGRAKAARTNFEKLIRDYPEFLPEMRAVADRIGTDPDWLLNVIAYESSFVTAARNSLPGQTASGLLQFIESTARSLGTSTAAIRRMNPLEQLKLIEKYLSAFRGRLNSLGDLYLAVFRGFIIEGGPETVIAPLTASYKEKRAYLLNRNLDIDRDGRIEKGELADAAFSVGRFAGEGVVIVTNQTQSPVPRITQRSLYLNDRAAAKQDLSQTTRSLYFH
jgi:hypothetical protein